MNILLIFFALPIAVVIISIALQRILRCPSLVAAIIFAIFLIVTFIINNLNFLVVAIVYAIISFITATIIQFICRFFDRDDNDDDRRSSCFSCICGDDRSRRRRRDRNDDRDTSNNNCGRNCSCQTINSNGVTARINIIPNDDDGRTGSFCGNFRRRC